MRETRRIYFVRHGQKKKSDTYNSLANQSLELTRSGIEQAKGIGIFLFDHKITHIYSSSHVRALQTAKITAERIGTSINIDKRFGERVLLTRDVSARVSKHEFMKSQHDWDYHSDGGESLNAAVARFSDAIKDTLAHSTGDIAIFTHGRILQSYLGYVFRSPEYLANELIINQGDICIVDYKGDLPTSWNRVFSPIAGQVSGEVTPTLADTVVIKDLETKTVIKTHLFKRASGHAIQANIYEKNSLDLLHALGVQVPGNRKLIGHGNYINMNYISGDNFGNMLSSRRDVQTSAKQLGRTLRKIHDSINAPSLAIPFSIIEANPNMNSHCALNFSHLTSKSPTPPEQSLIHDSFTKGVSQAMKILSQNPTYLASPDIIHGDYKPDNIVIGSRSMYVIDPHLSYGRMSCDLGKMIARFYLTRPDTAAENTAALLEGYKPSSRMIKEIRHMAGFDILNTFSRLLAKNQFSSKIKIQSHTLTIQNMEYCLKHIVPMLFNSNDILILRHLDDIQDFRIHYRNTRIIKSEEQKIPNITKSIIDDFKKRSKNKICFITSPQIRAKQTANLVINEISKLSPSIETYSIKDKRILDLYHGKYVIPSHYKVGQKLPALPLSNKAYINQTFSQRNLDYKNGDPLNGKHPELTGLFSEYGETQREFSARFYSFMGSFLDEVSKNSDTLFIVVAHTAIVFRLFELSYLLSEESNVPLGELSFKEWEQAYRLDRNPGNQLFVTHGEIKHLNVDAMMGYSWRFLEEVKYLRRRLQTPGSTTI